VCHFCQKIPLLLLSTTRSYVPTSVHLTVNRVEVVCADKNLYWRKTHTYCVSTTRWCRWS